MADFVHLHNHSEYSLLDGLSKTAEMVARAKELGMSSIAITDHGNLYGAIRFYKECKEQGIKPIIGCEIYVAKRSRFDKTTDDKDYNHLILLAKNQIGYKNLMKIVTSSHLEGFYYKPRTDLELLKKYKDGLICLSACLSGYISEPLLAGQKEEAILKAKTLYEIYGGDFYLELQKHINIPRQDELNIKLLALSRKLGIPVVATNDNHYINKDDAEAQEILLCIGTQTTIITADRKLSMLNSPDFYIKDQKEMQKLFSDTPDALENTLKIAEKCNLEITLGKWIMPTFEVPASKTPAEYLTELVDKGLKERYKTVTEEIKERVKYELSIIINKGYEAYFLIVQDFANWAKNNEISVGPGRGSAAGSVVSYALNITDVDPFFFKLPFERFLNPFRPSAPDIDLDFADTRRDEVIKYVTSKYGDDKVAQIITFGTMEARGAVRDAGRALGMPYAVPDRIAKMIPPGWQGHAMTIEKALEQSPDLKRAYREENDTKRLLDVAKKLEGVARHASTHAAGVVIANKNLTEYTPLQRESNGERIVTQYDMYTVGEDGVGLLKMDFLGLRNLTIIEETLRFVKQNQNISLDVSKFPLDDKKTYKLLSNAETTGIFQLESAGMRRYIKELQPSSIFDLMAMVALYRPGPMQNIPEFIARKHNPSLIKYPDERLKDVLSQSYGILAYQDDVLLTSIAIAGYTWLDADKFRKAMGKKIPAVMKKQEETFVKGAVKNGLTQKKAEEIYNLIAPFAGYGFNKAHASCYATIAFRTAYLKAHYSVEFMTALLTAESRGSTGPAKNEKISQAVAECRRLNVNVLPPSINFSGDEFSIEDTKNVRFGLSAIKNVGSAAISTILGARANGKFESFSDFCLRVDLSKVNKKTLESLIKAGAMDEFGKRASLLYAISSTVDRITKEKNKVKSQASLFDNEPPSKISYEGNIPLDLEEFSDKEKLLFEKELLGFFLSDHPLSAELDNLIKYISHQIQNLIETPEGTRIKVGGLLSGVKKIITKKSNSEMAFITLEDHAGFSIECVVFPKTFEQYKNILLRDTIVLISGKLDFKDEIPVILVDTIERYKNTNQTTN
ncbi:MAG: DNA polymerase III subunit alpha [Candidatus Levybacteria bacterium CG_4_10_14_0_2_um_filter_36_16]|nr:MAG: DNA polymerase III subunit alpha [Candidatus Levybacteria bacterium CG2_30_37_29]PIR79379.1 MAG: DNA polymerase III subunit alpha [Candidatus Levybacteria bacterium CG10_big_fil_rev_8_21_14_0_10_36_30]PIZ96815.1 MAG: DNA polymerase III subunit alpha [Candidatus Levybacteria bacterium CG_4_10_14_0_2_um_filter_36_16]PJA90425.1 MAG: DNA polymerase III subunit alpha [Candidatus Levybacteria bacterium CG_4_9_14_3_um_filter_36_7]